MKALPFQSWLPVRPILRLQLILRGIKRSQGDNSKTRRPITLHILNLFYHLLNVKYTRNKDSLMVWAAITDTCLFRFSSYWGTNLRFSLQS